MSRLLVSLLVVVLALGTWFALQLLRSEPELAPAVPPVAAPQVTNDAIAATPQATPTTAVDAERVQAPASVPANEQPPIPEDAIWLDVRVVDAETQQPVAGAEVRWSAVGAMQQVAALPERERAEFYADRERTAVRFGWLTRTDREGLARVAADRGGASVHARSEGRYGTADIGGGREVPKGGWVIELERDLTLRARVVDALGRPAVGALVGVRMFDSDGKALRSGGAIWAQQTKPPEGLAEFRHAQRWLRSGTSRKRYMEVGHWRIAPEAPGVDGAAVEFDVDNPPAEPVELRLPATGSLAVRLLHDGRALTKGVYFQVYRGEESDFVELDNTPRLFADDDGWTRLPFVAVGGSVLVVARVHSAIITRTVEAPRGQDQEVRVELTTEEHFALRGQFVGPDGNLLADTTVTARYDFEVQGGSAIIDTDAQGRFLWLLSKGHRDRMQIKRLVFSQRFDHSTPARTLTVTPREIHRGVNDLGVLQLSNGALVVAGQLQFDTPQPGGRSWFEVEALGDNRGRNGEGRWQRVDGLTTSVRDDGSFEVRGETKALRHRLAFRWGGYLPIAPIEFRVGATDLVIPIQLGHRLRAKVLVDDSVPIYLLQCALRPGFTPPTEYGNEENGRSSRDDRYQADCLGHQLGEAALQWRGLPAGTYTLEVGAAGIRESLVRIENVVLPLPEGGDDRVEQIDLRGKLQILEVHVSRPEDGEGAQRRSRAVCAFPQPQADEQNWRGLTERNDKLLVPVVPGPMELMVVGEECQPQRVPVTAEQVASGKLTVELRSWPKVELLFADLPTLPEGVVLHAFSSPAAPGRDLRRFTTPNSSGELEYFLTSSGDGAQVVNGRAAVTVSDGTFRLGVYLDTKEGGRPQELHSVTPQEIQGGENLAPITVQLSADEIKAAIEKLAEGSK